ncbi:ubiquinol-cytochrome c reductase iron-sulfur subunit [Spectribacter hydrogenoxidans]|uniref:Ubiquinol-cytochrome c reductase iron-sulfur subunit n=1 Tax=Spectribacter hydrogenoxidans TaxID=3075608 RepID=A0ABU3BX23_9GAMM|nr:ubiquinol-cytochrome c reductase iron-sulfur subunit [Salinisphaera sp. W335]MDT0633857.1 ubiquinol-cytochrome c reductase iron-sulfur subunit [Salinisphaera sp. W335]
MSNEGVDVGKRRFLTTATSAVGGVGAAFVAVPFISSWQPSARARAAGAPVEVNVGELEPGARLTVVWRGKPVWIVRRTDEMLASLEPVSGELRDPDSEKPQQPSYCQNAERSIKPEYLVMVGLCTHLGCLPDYRPDNAQGQLDYPGFFCACHGSAYDIAGRVYKGVPAPLNMTVPPHRYADDNVIVVGEDPESDTEAA